MRRARLTLLLALGGALAPALSPRAARADDAPSAELLKSAAEEYDRGRRAFLADDFEGAGVHFENAYRDAPRAETLRLAIRARRKSKQLARAATLAAVAMDRYPNDVTTAQLAKETLDEVGPHLHEYLVTCTAVCAVTADGRVVSQTDGSRHRLYLDPGSHELGVSFKQGGSVAKRVDAKKGGKDTLAFEPPPVVVPPPAAGDVAVTRSLPTAERSSKPLAPVVFFVAAGLTLAVAGGTVFSGIDARNHPGADAVRLACAGKDTSCPEYQEGKSAELRTNILLGATAGALVITGVIGIFFTRWSSSPTAATSARAVRFGPGIVPGGGSVGALGQF